MYKVYILQSIDKPNKTYVGLTIKDVKDRLKEHNLGLSKASKAYKPWKFNLL
jgi:predicted GIY-YIG superfamily endonuclease